jgi:sigma-B regulation protein RsbU (phosphoserine phosphatase)
VVFGILTLRPGGCHAVIASGGHPEPLVLRGDGTADYHRTRGRLVGVFPGSVYTNTEVTLHPGDTLVLYTDGVTEARARAGANADPRFGVDALARFASGLAPAGAQRVIDAFVELLDAFGSGLDDDTAVMAIGVPAAPAS